MKRLAGRRGVAAAVVVVAGIAVGGIAYASIPDANGVIHGCYRPTSGQLIVATSGKGCEEGWTALNWNQTGPTGLTGPTGPTGATGATGPTGTLSSAYIDALYIAVNPETVAAGNPILFTVVGAVSGITIVNGATFTVPAGGVYQVTVGLQGPSSIPSAQLTVNGVSVGPPLQLACGVLSCTFTRLLILNAGDTVQLLNLGPGNATVYSGSAITIVRIA